MPSTSYSGKVSVESASARVWNRWPIATDAAFVAVLWALDLLVSARAFGEPRSLAQATLTALALAAVPLRQRYPLPALALTVLAAMPVTLMSGRETFALAAPILALYTTGLRSERRTTVFAWLATVAVLAPAVSAAAPEAYRLEAAFSTLPWTATAAAVGHAVRTRRSLLAALQERALRAERTREEEALRRVAEERVRIARELHDAVAHHIAVVSVQAGAAQHLLATEPAAAADAIGEVRRAAVTVLDELKDLLYVLRQANEVDASTAPTPGLDRLGSLLASFAGAGLQVHVERHGTAVALPPTSDLVAYRIIEEALTNALKYGTGTASLALHHSDGTLRVQVRNRMAPASGRRPEAVEGTGFGLLGMRERATAVGGTVAVHRESGHTFVVDAVIPVAEERP